MMIPRTLSEQIENKLLHSNKIIVLYGSRQVGKTTLVKSILSKLSLKKLEINADEKIYTEILSSRNLNKLRLLVEGYDLLFIDEAQRITDIGINLKILHDSFPQLKIIVTGSSSFELANKVKEPLTGRTWTYTLYPIGFNELRKIHNPIQLMNRVEEFLIYGTYPEIFSLKGMDEKKEYLKELNSAYLYKDIFELSSIKHTNKIDALLRLLAFQIGSQVSISELAVSLGMGKETVNSYIDLLEKSFVLFRLSGFSRNLRKEVTKMDKIYFYDLGIRNTIIENLNGLEYRNDVGQLWENYILIERKKYLAYQRVYANSFFWRTYTGSELDYLEERDGNLSGYEFKYSARKKVRPPRSWLENYPEAVFETVNSENFIEFISE